MEDEIESLVQMSLQSRNFIKEIEIDMSPL